MIGAYVASNRPRLQKAVEFEEDKKNGKFVANMGRIPILIVDGVEIGQSHAIFRYIAGRCGGGRHFPCATHPCAALRSCSNAARHLVGRYGNLGSNPLEAAQIDAICEHVRDIKDAFSRVRTIKVEEEKKAAVHKFYNTDLPEVSCRSRASRRRQQHSSGVGKAAAAAASPPAPSLPLNVAARPRSSPAPAHALPRLLSLGPALD